MQSKLSKFALAAVAGALITTGAAGTATAAGSSWHQGSHGRVMANGGLYVRAHRNTDSRIVGRNANGTIVTIKCKANGESVGGNRRWYKLESPIRGWSSARYIETQGRSPEWCDH